MTTQLVKCPECGKSARFDSTNEFKPFCSERCRLLDLGAWASESYRVPTEESRDDVMSEDLPPETR